MNISLMCSLPLWLLVSYKTCIYVGIDWNTPLGCSVKQALHLLLFFLLQSYANVLKYCHIFFLKIYHCYDTVLKYKVSFNANMHTQKARLVGSTQFSCFYY
jgi:hypothetical protein